MVSPGQSGRSQESATIITLETRCRGSFGEGRQFSEATSTKDLIRYKGTVPYLYVKALPLPRRKNIVKKLTTVLISAGVLTVAAVLAVEALLLSEFEPSGFSCEGRQVLDGEDLAVAVNEAPAGTTFCVAAGDYPLSRTVVVQDGDTISGEPGQVTQRGPAVDPDPVVHVSNPKGLARMFHVTAQTGRMEWLDIEGSPTGARYTSDTPETCDNWGEVSDQCPANGTGLGIGAGRSGPGFVFEHLEIRHMPSNCIDGLEGRLLRSDLSHCSENGDYWGYSAGALKTINESESAYNFVHDNEAVGLWCDHGCYDNPAMRNGWYQHDNLIVNNGRAGIRYEFAPMLGDDARSNQPTALIEGNRLAGNDWGGVDVHDAQNATVRDNTFGPMTVAGVNYSNNGWWVQEAMQFSEGDTFRTDLWNNEAYRNRLGGEVMNGCETYTDPEKLRCYNNVP